MAGATVQPYIPYKPPGGEKGKIIEEHIWYPEDLRNSRREVDYVQFTFWRYVPPFGNPSEILNPVDAISDFTKSLFSGDRKDLYSRNVIGKQITTPNSINMFIPEGIGSGYKSNWQGETNSGVVKSLLEAIGEGDLRGAVGQATNIDAWTNWALTEGAKELVKRTGQDISLNEISAFTRGSVLNPHVELLFDKPELRTFTLKFKLVPKNESESIIINKIARTFRKMSLPTTTQSALGSIIPDFVEVANSDNASIIRIPPLCQVKYFHRGELHPYLPAYKPLAITGVNMNFTPDNKYMTYQDGSPVATEISVSFLETKLHYGNDGDNESYF